MQGPRIYNLFPRLVGAMDLWPEWFRHAASLGFDWVYLNPFHYPGFSGSLYAVKDYYRLNPLFAPRARDGDLERCLRALVEEAREAGVRLMMDLVINHTSKDSDLVRAHPAWYVRGPDGEVKSPSAIDPADARRVTVWGDLAEIDNAGSADREGLWAWWEELVRFHARIGFEGYRCDAAYQVPAELWRRLIDAARAIRPGTIFLAETLGCRLDGIEALRGAGFDFFCSSSRWWDFSAPWCIEQHEAFREIAPSVSFPESHDTERLAAQASGREDVARQRYLFACTFSTGVLAPIGFEYGFRRRLDVVRTTPEGREEPAYDIGPFIAACNRRKAELAILNEEGRIEVLFGLDGPVLAYRKTGRAPESLLVLINKDWWKHQPVWIESLAEAAGRPGARVEDATPGAAPAPVPDRLDRALRPAEVRLYIAR